MSLMHLQAKIVNSLYRYVALVVKHVITVFSQSGVL